MAAEPSSASPAPRRRSSTTRTRTTNGGTTYEVYRYVTWYDSPQDGTGAGDAADGNNNGVSDANGHDAKRVTVVVVWTNNVTGPEVELSESSLFSDGRSSTRLRRTTRHRPSLAPRRSISGNARHVLRGGVRLRRHDRERVAGTSGTGTTGNGSGTDHAHVPRMRDLHDRQHRGRQRRVDRRRTVAAGCTSRRYEPDGGNGGPDGAVSINGRRDLRRTDRPSPSTSPRAGASQLPRR